MRHCPMLVALLAAVLGSLGCRSASGPNVVFITLDTTRADRLGAMGYAAAKTPVLDALAARGVVFERAYASSPVTMPSHATFLTGLEPPVHGVRDNGVFVLKESAETVAERLAAKGYATAAFVSAFVLDASFGLHQGFDVYDAETPLDRNPLVATVPRRNGDSTTDAALSWLADRGSRPFFLWAHYYDVHLPRIPPPPYDEMPDPYDGALAFVDRELGRLFEGVRKAAGDRETLIVVTADHGEGLGEHDEWTHGAVVYDSTLHIPLIVTGPGFEPGTRSTRYVRAVDVAETLLVAAGAPRTAGDGVALQSGAPAADRVGYFESRLPVYTFGWAPIGGVRTGRWKLTAEPSPIELYDVLDDPKETRNRASEHPDVVSRLTEAYAALAVDANAVAAPPEVADEGVADRLEALGYISAPQSFGENEIPDPRRHVATLSRIETGRALAFMGRVAEGVQLLEGLATDRVARVLALRTLAPIYLSIGRKEDAVSAFRGLTEVLGSAEARTDLAAALVAAGRPEEGLAELDALTSGPAGARRGQERIIRAAALLEAGRFDEGEREAAAILEGDPENDRSIVLEARARVLRGGVSAIPAELERLRRRIDASERPDRLPLTRLFVASLLHERGRDKEAIALLEVGRERPVEHLELIAQIAKEKRNLPKATDLLEQVVRRQPSNQRALIELTDLYDEQRKFAPARRLYDLMIAANPADATLWVDRGTFAVRLDDPAGAEADYRKALEIDPKQPEAALNLAMILIAKGDDGEAEELLLRAVEARPDYAKAHFHLARIYRARKDPRAEAHAEQSAAGGRAVAAAAADTGSPP